MRIDTHQHFWRYNDHEYTWIRPNMAPLKQDHLPADLVPLLKESAIDATIAVQARQCIDETRFLLELADQNPFIKAVVGWVDLCSPQLEMQLERFCYHPKLRAVRHVVHDEPDDRFMIQDDFLHGISKLSKYNLAYDLLLFPRHLPVACEMAGRFPDITFVLDHIAKPLIRQGKTQPWDSDIRRLAEFKNVSCKISDMVTEADSSKWKPQDFEPYMDIVLKAFGPNRIMIGSDWPVCTLAAEYSRVIDIAAECIKKLSPNEQQAIWWDNAIRIYQIPI
jgi:L-fuconolactonase